MESTVAIEEELEQASSKGNDSRQDNSSSNIVNLATFAFGLFVLLNLASSQISRTLLSISIMTHPPTLLVGWSRKILGCLLYTIPNKESQACENTDSANIFANELFVTIINKVALILPEPNSRIMRYQRLLVITLRHNLLYLLITGL